MCLKKIFLAAALLACSLTPISAGITFYDGKFCDPDDIALLSCEEHFEFGCEAYYYHDWKHSIRHFHIVAYNFPDHPCADIARYYLAVSYYYYGEYEFANTAFTQYLKASGNREFLEDAIEYKFLIAEAFRANKAKRHLYGSKSLPAWMPAAELSLEIYDEIITSFPCHPIAADALMCKAAQLWKTEEYRQSVEAYQTLIRRFPKHEMAPESYLLIARLYWDQARREFQNADLLALSELNLKKFEHDFPSEERLDEARYYVQQVKETFAKGLYETGRFFERCGKIEASAIYYQNALQKFPETSIAERCRKRMRAIQVDFAEND